MSASLDIGLREPLCRYLLAWGDDELILAQRDAEWTGHAPILEEDIAFANIAQDELGHAILWYEMAAELGAGRPDESAYGRPAAAFRNVQLVELPRDDWAFSMLRQYLWDAYERCFGELAGHSAYRPLQEAWLKVRPEESYHYRHTSGWLLRLGQGTEEGRRRSQAALDALWPLTGQLFSDDLERRQLAAAGLVPQPAALRTDWLALVEPHLAGCGLVLPLAAAGLPPGREAHTPHLAALVADLQAVAQLDPAAEW
ncbi:MAG: 1,2-phenylacetyl-CoA epoxidase subunit PaaC [Candidatus Promineifilaceae bacterium]